MKQQYKAWQLPFLSFYSKPLYKEMSARWSGTNLGYLCILLAVCLIPLAHNAGREAMRVIDQKADIFLMQIPPSSFLNGRLSVEAPQPYSIIEGNQTVLLIDTTGQVKTLEDTHAIALLTATHLHVRQGSAEPYVKELANFGELEVNQEIVAHIINRTKRVFVPVYYLATYGINLILFLLLALILGSIGRIIAIIRKKRLDYTASLRLAVTALTPPLIIGGFFEIIDHPLPVGFHILLAFIYLLTGCGLAEPLEPNDLYLDDEPVGH